MPLGRGLSSLIPPKKDDAQSRLSQASSEEKSVVDPLSGFNPVPADVLPQPFSDLDAPSVLPDRLASDQGFTASAAASFSDSRDYIEEGSVFLLDIDKVKPNPYQPRREFDEEKLQELAQSIREFGILQPLVVSKVEIDTSNGADVEYQVIAGERRLRAAKLVGLTRVPAIVRQVDTNKEKLELAIIENVQRSDLSPIEAARAYARLQDEFNLTQREIAQRVGKSREVVANTLRLLNLPQVMQEALQTGKINESQARLLLSVSSLEKQQQTFDNLVSQKLSVRKLREKIVPSKDPEGLFYERKLEEYLGAPVKLSRSGDGGKLVIQFYSDEEWKGIVEKILRGEGGGI